MDYREELSALVRHAAREVETMKLAGLDAGDLADDKGNVPLVGYDELEHALQEALTEVRRLRTHMHRWDYGETDNDPVRCRDCGADGLA